MALLLLDNLYRETVDTRVYRGAIDEISCNYDDFEKQMFEFAEAMSRSPHFEIIDSYTTHWWDNRDWEGQQYHWDPDLYRDDAVYVAKRYKGDPITATETRSGPGYTYPIWKDYRDLGGTNSWFVIECQTENPALAAMGYSTQPKWQMLVQWHDQRSGFADVSDPDGSIYTRYYDEGRVALTRFAPWGGWDLADSTPDFDPATPPLPSGATPSSDNLGIYLGDSTYDNKTQFIITAKGSLYLLTTKDGGGRRFYSVGIVAGDVLPRTTAHMSNPRAIFSKTGRHDDFSEAKFLEEGGPYNGAGRWTFWDHEDVLHDLLAYTTQRRTVLAAAQSSPYNDYYVADTHPILVFPYSSEGLMFELGHMRKMYCMSTQTIDDKKFLLPRHGWQPIFPWDGVTDPYSGY